MIAPCAYEHQDALHIVIMNAAMFCKDKRRMQKEKAHKSAFEAAFLFSFVL